MLDQVSARIIPALYLALLAVLSAGCGSSGEADISAAKSSDVQGIASTDLVPISFADWELKRKSYVPNIVVVDLWAGWCVPCLERFPHMIEMHHKYADRGVQFVSMSLDDRDDPADVEFAQEFLIMQNATFPNFLLDEPILEGFELIGVRTVPAVYVYDRRGELADRLTFSNPSKQFTDIDIEEIVLALLKE